ncbi:MAG TPA: deoxyribodipyrimidine photo-lyase [Lichenihabitans sp.]|jgi:deoxyribodipyrimidine photo-lyase|nr:deoxyribodipyrimidine photo-lyase [Lichenihabitans sp.]
MTTNRRADDGSVIVWFRDDLRLADNPALVAAAQSGRAILPVYVHDEESHGIRRLGGAARWWLHHSLTALSGALKRHGADLHIFNGPAVEIVPKLAHTSGAAAVCWNRRYQQAEGALDDTVAVELEADGVEVETFNGKLIHEPDEIRPKSGFYKVYSAYWKAADASGALPEPEPAPKRLRGAEMPSGKVQATTLGKLGLLPTRPDWSGGLAQAFTPGETEALRKLGRFVETDLAAYGERRDNPGVDGSSRLSPHLRFGEISPRQIVAAVKEASRTAAGKVKAQKFLQEIAWRDFSYNLLFHAPDLATSPFAERFEHFPWADVPKASIRAWQQGRTGYPIVDAGMRQLWRTGWMHNRVRMITASFLVKDLLCDWRVGERWFWDTLCDADPANNAVNWQWVAGCGPDAAPFFRIFNPVLQGEKFDPKGTYVREFVPEIKDLDARFVHKPWEAPAEALHAAGIRLGETYPHPRVRHDEARDRALAAFKASREG